MTDIQRSKTVLRLQKYLESIQANTKGTAGELKAFWDREHRKTSAKIGKL